MAWLLQRVMSALHCSMRGAFILVTQVCSILPRAHLTPLLPLIARGMRTPRRQDTCGFGRRHTCARTRATDAAEDAIDLACLRR